MGKNPCFEVGQLAEARSFEEGYRGAWFRCKIKKPVRKKGRIEAYTVEYYDYPEDPAETVKLYKFPSESSRGHKAKKELMLRPQFPPYYQESMLPDVNTIVEVIAAVADVWRIGDLVDWFADGCFWSGTITEVIDDDVVKITLLEPPRGEGLSYVANCKDLRPTLDWSPDTGWTVPLPLESQKGHFHARLIQPVKQAPLSKSLVSEIVKDKQSLVSEIVKDKQNVKVTPRSSLDFNQSISSRTSVSSLPQLSSSTHSKGSLQEIEDIATKKMQQTHGVNVDMEIGGSAVGKHSCSDSVSGTYVRDVSAEVPVATCAAEHHEKGSAKKMRLSETMALNSSSCDSVESAILDLEELVNKVKWLKQILRHGISSTPKGPTWEFLEDPAAVSPK